MKTMWLPVQNEWHISVTAVLNAGMDMLSSPDRPELAD